MVYINHRFLYALGAVALLVLIAGGLLGGPAGFRHEPRSAEAATLIEVKKLIASDAQAGDEFGRSAAASGDTAVVGAPFEDGTRVDNGAAYVFQRNVGGTDNWGEVKKLIALNIKGDPTSHDSQADGDQFGTSVAIDGDLIVVGAPFNDVLGLNAGAAYVYGRNQGGIDNWGFVKKLFGSNIYDRAGSSVAISGLTAIVGAPEPMASPAASGKAFVYERDFPVADHWGERAELNASDAEIGDRFGGSVALDGDTTLVGANGEDAGGINAGAAYVFERNEPFANGWGEVKKLTASDAEANDFFGSTSVNGDTAFVIGGGVSYVFERNEPVANAWGEVKILIAGVRTVEGDTAQSGPRVLKRNEGGAENWGQVNLLTASDAEPGDNFGASPDVSGDTSVVGAYGEDAGGPEAGAAYVFDLLAAKPTATLTPTITLTPTVTPTKQADPGDTDQDGCTDVAENGTNESFGGLRDYTYFWDFYDVWTTDGAGGYLKDKVINLVGDILGVANRFGSGPTPVSKAASLAEALATPASPSGYHRAYDRGPIIGPNNWNRAPADGAINIVDDVMGVAAQFGHNCT